MESFTPVSALVGGALIGLGAALLLLPQWACDRSLRAQGIRARGASLRDAQSELLEVRVGRESAGNAQLGPRTREGGSLL